MPPILKRTRHISRATGLRAHASKQARGDTAATKDGTRREERTRALRIFFVSALEPADQTPAARVRNGFYRFGSSFSIIASVSAESQSRAPTTT